MENVFDQFDQQSPAGNGSPLRITVYPGNAQPPPEQTGNVFDRFDTPVSATGAAVQGLKSGVTAGFNDEISGLSAAGRSGLPPEANQALDQRLSPVGHLISAIGGGARLGYENLIKPLLGESNGGLSGLITGDTRGEITKAYEEGRDKVRAAQAAAQAQQPGAYLAGNIGGALATLPISPEVALAKGAGLGARTINAGLTGGMYGGLFGAGAGEGAQDTLNQATNGAAVGTIGGAALTPVIAGIGRAANAVTRPIQAALNPEKIAAQKVFGAIAADRPGTTPNNVLHSMEMSHTAGEPVVLADLGRSSKQGGRGAVHALSRDAADSAIASKLPASVSTRFEDQGKRFHDDIVSVIGGHPEAVGAREAIQEAARKANKPAYAAAYRSGSGEVRTPELERLAGSPAVADAMRAAVEKGKDRAIADGFGAFNPPAKVENGQVVFNKKPNGTPAYPDIQFWDYTYRALRDEADAAFRAGRNDAGNSLKTLAKKLRDELDKAVPLYGQARAGAARFFGADDALTAGEQFVNSRLSNEEARRAIAKMNPQERKAFQYGFASEMLKTISEIPLKDRSTIASKAFLNSPAAKERIQMALGPDGARRLEARVRLENMMEATRAAVKDGSHTSKLLKQGGLMTGSGLSTGLLYGFATGDWDTKDITIAGALGAVVKGGHAGISMKVAGKVSDLLASHDPQAIRDAVELVSRDPRLMDAIRRADALITRTVNSTPPHIIGGVAPQIAGHADQEQPNR